jgi:hypothetical protein
MMNGEEPQILEIREETKGNEIAVNPAFENAASGI